MYLDLSQIEGLGTAGSPVGGVLSVQGAEGATYSATAAAFTCAAAATDVFTISGSATKTIRIHKFKVTATTTSGSAIKVTAQLFKRTTLNTGGTAVTDGSISHDSSDAAATAIIKHYTANPTALGTSLGSMRSDTTSVSVTGISGGVIEWVFNEAAYRPVILRGVNESLAVNLSGVSITGGVVSISVEWMEI